MFVYSPIKSPKRGHIHYDWDLMPVPCMYMYTYIFQQFSIKLNVVHHLNKKNIHYFIFSGPYLSPCYISSRSSIPLLNKWFLWAIVGLLTYFNMIWWGVVTLGFSSLVQWLTVNRFDSLGEIDGTAAEHHPGGWGRCGQEGQPHHSRHGQKGSYYNVYTYSCMLAK